MYKIKNISFVVCVFSFSAFAEDGLVYINTVSPYEVKVRKLEKEALEKTIKSTKPNKLKWKEFEDLNVSYVVQQEAVSIVERDPCFTLPIKVFLKRGRLVSAKYASSGGKCRLGSNVSNKILKSEGFYITPKQLFERLENANEQLKCYLPEAGSSCLPTALSVVYNEKYGLPIKMNDSSDLVMDYSWSLNITELEVYK